MSRSRYRDVPSPALTVMAGASEGIMRLRPPNRSCASRRNNEELRTCCQQRIVGRVAIGEFL